MTDNSHYPSKSIHPEETPQITIYWKPVLIGFAIGFIGGCILAALWGIVGFVVYFFIESAADTFYKGPIAATLAWCVGIVPFAVGLVYVCRAIEDARVANCLVVAALRLASSIPFIYFDEDPFEWTITVYYLIEFALAGAIGAAWSRKATR